jgi:hydroxymethylglutaryl-CoA reductase
MQKNAAVELPIILKDKTDLLPNISCATERAKDSMGANFINSCLEQFSKQQRNNIMIYSQNQRKN